MFYYVPLARTPVIKTKAATSCIYCGKQPPEVELTGEHVIADGLGGDLLLVDGSCRDCAKLITPLETAVITSALGHARAHYDIRSRKRAARIRMMKVTGKDGVTFEVPAKDAPLVMQFPVTGEGPGFLRAYKQGEPYRLGLFEARPKYNSEDLRPAFLEEGQSVRWAVKIDLDAFGRTLAKTAHAFAVACLGEGAFEPFLCDYIRRGNPMGYDPYFIGDSPPLRPRNVLHEVSMCVIRAIGNPHPHINPGDEFCAVNIRFFANLVTPTYLVLVGRRRAGSFKPLWQPAPKQKTKSRVAP